MLNKSIARYLESRPLSKTIKCEFALSFKRFKSSLLPLKIAIASFMEGSYFELDRDYLYKRHSLMASYNELSINFSTALFN